MTYMYIAHFRTAWLTIMKTFSEEKNLSNMAERFAQTTLNQTVILTPTIGL